MQDVRWKVPGWKEGTGDEELWFKKKKKKKNHHHQEEHQRGSGAWSLGQQGGMERTEVWRWGRGVS